MQARKKGGRLKLVLETWYTLVPPENFMLIIGTDTDKEAPPGLATLGPGTAVWFPCGPGYISGTDLFCKTTLAVESIRALEATDDTTISLDTILTDVSRPQQRRAEELYLNKTSRLTVHRQNKIRWYCVLDDDLYVNVDRLGKYLEGKDAALPQMYGSFCTGNHSSAHACGVYCASASLFKLPGDTVMPVKYFKHSNLTGGHLKDPDDVLLGRFTPPPVEKHDLASMPTQYDLIVHENGSVLSDPTSTLQALKQTLVFNFESHLPAGTDVIRYHSDLVSTTSITNTDPNEAFKRDRSKNGQGEYTCSLCPDRCHIDRQCLIATERAFK
jgi:hypothetical protein